MRHLNPAEVKERLAAPFPAAAVEWRPGKVSQKEGRPPAALAMAYIDARAVINRLDAVVGVDRWQSEHVSLGDKQIGCRIGILFESGWIYKSDGTYVGNLESQGKIDSKEEGRLEMEAKGSFSVAIKRAAVSWGIGRYLYDIEAIWADVEQRGSSWVFSRAGLAKLDRIADDLYRKANRGEGGRMPVYEPEDETSRAPVRDERGPGPRRAEPPPPQRTPASQAQPADDPAHVALAEELFRRAKDPQADLAAVLDELEHAGLPRHLSAAPFVEVFVRVVPTLRSEANINAWAKSLRNSGAVVDLFTRVAPKFRDGHPADAAPWMRLLVAAQIPQAAPERAALKPVLDEALRRVGWAPAHLALGLPQQQQAA